MSDEESTLGTSPSRSIFAGGSDLFKTALNDYILDASRVSKVELDRYNKKKNCKITKSEDHVVSARCDACVTVKNLCKCEDDIGHASRVHWADEVWNRPLFTILDDSDSETEHDSTDDVDGPTSSDIQCRERSESVSKYPKPILKHRANCIIVVSN